MTEGVIKYIGVNYGCKPLKTETVLMKTYYVFVNPNGSDETSFKRFAYQLENDDRHLIVIRYKGNHNVMKQYKDMKKQTCFCEKRARVGTISCIQECLQISSK